MTNISVSLAVSERNEEFFEYIQTLRKNRMLSKFIVLILQAYHSEPAIQTLVNKYMEETVDRDMSEVHAEKPEEEVFTVGSDTKTDYQQAMQLGELTQIVGQLKELLEPVNTLTHAMGNIRKAANDLGTIRDDLGGIVLEQLPGLLKQKDNSIEKLGAYLDKEMEFRHQMLIPLMQKDTGYTQQVAPMQQPMTTYPTHASQPLEPVQVNPQQEVVLTHNTQPLNVTGVQTHTHPNAHTIQKVQEQPLEPVYTNPNAHTIQKVQEQPVAPVQAQEIQEATQTVVATAQYEEPPMQIQQAIPIQVQQQPVQPTQVVQEQAQPIQAQPIQQVAPTVPTPEPEKPKVDPLAIFRKSVQSTAKED